MANPTPRYTQQTSAPRPSRLATNVAPEPDQSPRRAIENFGGAISDQIGYVKQDRARAAERDAQREAQFALTDGISQEARWQKYADDAVQAAPANGSGLVDKFDKEFGEFQSQAMSGYKTEEGRNRAEVIYNRIKNVTRDHLLGASARLLATDSDQRRRTALSDAEKIVNLDPTRYGAIEATASGMVAELPGIDEATRNRFIAEQRRSLAVSAGYGAVSKSPYSVLRELSQEKPSTPWAAHLDVDDVMRLRSAAQSEVNRRESEAHAAQIEAQANLRADLADAFAARSYGAPAQLPARERFVSAFGKDGSARYADARDRWSIYDVVGESAFLPPAQAEAQLATLRPTGQDGAAAKAENYEAARRIYSEQRRALEADPVAVLTQRDPAMRQARESLATQDGSPPPAGAIDKYFSTLRARQQALGIAEPKLLPESQRTAIAANLVFDPNAPLKRVQTIATLQNSYGSNFPAVMQEVAPKLDGIARVLINMEPKEAERLDAAFAQKETYAKTMPPKATSEIKAALQDHLRDFATTMADNPDAEDRIAEHMEAATLLAQSAVLRGSSPADAAKSAATAVINGQYNYRDMLRIPKAFDDSHVVEALARAKNDLSKNGAFTISANKGSNAEQAQKDMRNVVGRQGYWITNENGTGAVLRIPHRSGLGDVYRADGSRVELSFDDLAKTNLVIPSVPYEAY